MHFCTNKNKKSLEIFHKERLIFKGPNAPLDLSALIEGAGGNAQAPKTTQNSPSAREPQMPQGAWDKMVDNEAVVREELDSMHSKNPVNKVRSLTRRAVNRAKGIPGAIKSIPLLGPTVSLPGKLAGKVGRGVKRLLRRR